MNCETTKAHCDILKEYYCENEKPKKDENLEFQKIFYICRTRKQLKNIMTGR